MKSVRIWSFSGPYLSVFSPNAGKYGPEKLLIWTRFTQCTYKESNIDFSAFLFGLHQLIFEPTHMLDRTSFCIDLIFTSQPNLVMES